MKIALVTYGMLGGGLENILLSLAKQFKQSDMDVTIITTEVPGPWFTKIADQGIHSIHIEGLGIATPFEHVQKVGEILKAGNYDVIFLNHARFAQAAIGLLPDPVAVIPIVHSLDEVYHRLSCTYSNKCNVLIGVSPLVVKMLAVRIPGRPVIMIPNGIAEINSDFCKKRVFDGKRLKLIYIGRLHHQEKGVLMLPEIIKRLAELKIDFFLNIVGDGSDRNILANEIEKLNMSDKVKLWGNLDTETIYQLLSESHCLLFPSLREAFGLVLVEAQMCGCIPVASRIEGVTDFIINDWENGILVTKGNVEEFCQALIKIMDNPSKAEELSENAIKDSHGQFVIEKTADCYGNLITDVINGRYPLTESRIGNNNNEIMNEISLDLLAMCSNEKTEQLYRIWLRLLKDGNKGISHILHQNEIDTVAIFGTLRPALYLLSDLNLEGIQVAGFLDNNQQMQGKELMNIPVYSPEWLKENSNKIDAVIISIEGEGDILVKDQLAKLIKNHCANQLKVISWKDLINCNV